MAPPNRPPATPQAADICPRCGGAFHCGAADAAPCPCGTLVLGAELRAELRRRYTGCLCLRCLAELAASVRTSGVGGSA